MQPKAWVHEATVILDDGIDPAAVGAAVTVALCGHWEHEGPCRWPHNNQIDGTRFRTLFIAPADEEPEVRRRIRSALRDSADWRVDADHAREVAPDEEPLAATLLKTPRRETTGER
jgi:hypothetical protein